MLCISRKRNESFVLTDERTGQQAKVVILSTADGKVRIGIEADPSVRIMRSELLDRGPRNERPAA